MPTIDDASCSTRPWAQDPPRHLISARTETECFFHTCLNAQTLEAYSRKFKCTVWLALPCKQWSCHYCAELKIRQLAVKTQDAKPNRLMTLTVDPARWDSPRHAFDGTRRQVPETIRALRKRFGDVEYLRVTELTQRGWPHYHLLVRSPYIPHAVLKDIWSDLTGAIIVDLRQVKDTFQSYTYLVKYLSKMHQIEWTERHVSYSRKFFPPPRPKVDHGLDLEDHVIIETHPGKLMYHQYRRATIVEIAYGVFALNPRQELVDQQTEYCDWCQPEEEEEPCSPAKTANELPTKSNKQMSLLPSPLSPSRNS